MSNTEQHRAFFGRRSGKRLHRGQQTLFETLLPELEITVASDLAPLAPRTPFDNPGAPLIMEIGYGGGEHLARHAAARPDVNFIGAEVFTGGIGKMLKLIEERNLTNIRLYTEDAVVLLADLEPSGLDGIDLLYPDPWPKTRHHKRRFVSPQSLELVARALKPGAPFRFATDIEDYANWTLAHIQRAPQLSWEVVEPGSWHTPYEGWQSTRYEEKARREGRLKSFYFTFRRTG